MTLPLAIEALLKQNGKKKVWLAEQLGYSSYGGVGNMFRRGNLTVGMLLKICDLLDYEVTIQPKRKAGSRPQGQFIIDGVDGVTKQSRKGLTDDGDQPKK